MVKNGGPQFEQLRKTKLDNLQFGREEWPCLFCGRPTFEGLIDGELDFV
jgi:hypothetical protein